MEQNENISAFAFKTGRLIEDLIKEETNNLENRFQLLESKVLMWYMQTKDKDFAEYFNITRSRSGEI